MEPVTAASLIEFFQRLGENYPGKVAFYLLGGSALCLLGNSRETVDIDYTTDLDFDNQKFLDEVIHLVASQLRLDVESVPLAEFIPLPPEADKRRFFIGRYGNIDVYVFDLYSIALSKIARGFDSDLDDVIFMLKEKLINISELEQHFNSILPDAARADIDRKEFLKYFGEVKRRLKKP
jgi:hypothetical protein